VVLPSWTSCRLDLTATDDEALGDVAGAERSTVGSESPKLALALAASGDTTGIAVGDGYRETHAEGVADLAA
jgi:hypothetical protein